MLPITFINRSGAPVSNVSEVVAMVTKYYAGLESTVAAVLAVFGSMALAERTKPLCLILEAGSGAGKTASLQMCFPTGKASPLANYTYRSDKFTPKSFVTHAANVSAKELAKMDMLPQLGGKVLLTKELAPIFRGREEEMRENFSTLISILDGKGFTSNSGMRGKRGYEQSIIFNWIGCTTPFPAATHRMMSQLGTRLLFYELPLLTPTEDELMAYARSNGAGKAEQECQLAVEEFLIEFFEGLPVGTVPVKDFTFPEDLLLQLVRWAQFLVRGRAEVKWEKRGTNYEPVAAMSPEGPHKVINYFKELAYGHAMIHERGRIQESDLELVAHVSISSIPGHLRPIVRELTRRDKVYTAQCVQLCRVSGPTARHYMQELSLLGIVHFNNGDPRTNEPTSVTLHKEFEWLNPGLKI